MSALSSALSFGSSSACFLVNLNSSVFTWNCRLFTLSFLRCDSSLEIVLLLSWLFQKSVPRSSSFSRNPCFLGIAIVLPESSSLSRNCRILELAVVFSESLPESSVLPESLFFSIVHLFLTQHSSPPTCATRLPLLASPISSLSRAAPVSFIVLNDVTVIIATATQ